MSDRSPHPFPWRLMALVAVLVVLATVATGFILTRQGVEVSGPEPTTAATPLPSQTPVDIPVEDVRQVTVLLMVRDDEHRSVSNVLLGAGGGTGFVSALLLPRDLVLPTIPPITLKQADGPSGPVVAEAQLELLLGLQIDTTFELDRLAWSGLIDATDTPVAPVLGVSQTSFPLVFAQVLSRLPDGEERMGQLLTSLGSLARTSVPNADASHLLAVLGRSLRTQQVRQAVLPVDYVRAGPARAALVDQMAAEPILTELFPLARLRPGHSGATRVVLQRAGAPLGAATGARLGLAGDGFGVVEDRGPHELTDQSLVFVPVAELVSVGRDVAAALGLSESTVRIDRDSGAVVDVRVVLGSDFAPV